MLKNRDENEAVYKFIGVDGTIVRTKAAWMHSHQAPEVPTEARAEPALGSVQESDCHPSE